MADEEKKFLLRLPPRVFDELRRWAEQDMRSINGQIEWLLREAVARHGGRGPLTGGSTGGSTGGLAAGSDRGPKGPKRGAS